jgi:hypothetical protein
VLRSGAGRVQQHWASVRAWTVASRPILRGILLVLLPAVLVTLYLAPRLVGLDRVVTVDERDWLGASANFSTALVHGDFAHTSQAEHGLVHPGVITMWTGTLAYRLAFPDYPRTHPQQIRDIGSVHEVLRALGHAPLAMLVAARQVKLLLQALVLAIGVWLLRPVFGTAITTVGALLMAFDPFLIAHDRLLHVDSLAALASFVSLAALLRALGQDRADPMLALSGAFAAVAWLNRTPGVVLAIVAGLVGCGVLWQQRGQGIPLSHAARALVPQVACWGGAALVTTMVAWPALWVAPVETYRRVLSGSLRMARMGHDWGTFFYGTTYRADWSLPYAVYYPVSLLWRLTPVALGGLVLVLVGIAGRDRILVPGLLRVSVVILAGDALLYLVTMSLGAKKFDHYLLPVYPVLDVLAAVGIVGAARLLQRQRARLGPFLAAMVLVGAVGGQLASADSVAPYYLPYFNPVLGGVPRASEALLVGWGEGMDQVADFILSQPGGEHARVRTTITPTTLLYFLPASATVTALRAEEDLPSRDVWDTTDYLVVYISQWQRGYFPRLVRYLSHYEPVHTVSFGGVDFARTYDVRAIPPPDELARAP